MNVFSPAAQSCCIPSLGHFPEDACLDRGVIYFFISEEASHAFVGARRSFSNNIFASSSFREKGTRLPQPSHVAAACELPPTSASSRDLHLIPFLVETLSCSHDHHETVEASLANILHPHPAMCLQRNPTRNRRTARRSPIPWLAGPHTKPRSH